MCTDNGSSITLRNKNKKQLERDTKFTIKNMPYKYTGQSTLKDGKEWVTIISYEVEA